ncbi:MAG: hypothetical protein KC503_18000, partial [Myxococcales bacterium]|nr:hypothetical protein [Myxococcales bacterium]
SSPRLGIDAAGDATVIWLELGFISTDIEAARYDAVSGTWSTPMRIDRSGDERQPVLAVSAGGTAMAAWLEVSGSGTFVDVRAASYR